MCGYQMSVMIDVVVYWTPYQLHRLAQYEDHILVDDGLGRDQEEVCRCDVKQRYGTNDRVD